MKIIITALLGIIAYCGNAQTEHNLSVFKKGDTFKKIIYAKSSCALKRGTQTLDINSYSEVLKGYKITDASNNNFNFDVSVQKVTDTINALGQQVHYCSDNAPDTASSIEKALKNLTGQTEKVTVDKNGFILAASKPTSQYANDTLLSFAGLQTQQFYKGGSLDLTAGFQPNPTLKKNYTWGDSSVTGTHKIVSKYTIDNVSASTTTISFSSAVFDSYINSNINGVLVVDNKSGLMLNRQMQSVSIGYELVNGLVYAITRRSAVTESSYKSE